MVNSIIIHFCNDIKFMDIKISSEFIFISKGRDFIGEPPFKSVIKCECSKSSIVVFEELIEEQIFDGLYKDNSIFEVDNKNNWIKRK